jgi:hypothetical protein
VWILNRKKSKKGKNVGHIFPIAKLVFSEIVDKNVESKFVIDQNEPDENDKQFIQEQIRRGFIFKLNSIKCDKKNSYYRFGPWTHDDDDLIQQLCGVSTRVMI